MTENKRFTMCYEQNDINGWTMSIVDWQTKQPFDYTTYEVHSESITDTKDEMEDLCLLLNELFDENEQLKSDLDYFKAKNGSLETGMFNLERENKKLKSENNILKVTIGRNEGYIDRLTHKGEWHC